MYSICNNFHVDAIYHYAEEQIGDCVITKNVVLHNVTPSSLVDTGLLSPEYGWSRRVREPTQLVLSFAVAPTNISEESTDTILREGRNPLL